MTAHEHTALSRHRESHCRTGRSPSSPTRRRPSGWAACTGSSRTGSQRHSHHCHRHAGRLRRNTTLLPRRRCTPSCPADGTGWGCTSAPARTGPRHHHESPSRTGTPRFHPTRHTRCGSVGCTGCWRKAHVARTARRRRRSLHDMNRPPRCRRWCRPNGRPCTGCSRTTHAARTVRRRHRSLHDTNTRCCRPRWSRPNDRPCTGCSRTTRAARTDQRRHRSLHDTSRPPRCRRGSRPNDRLSTGSASTTRSPAPQADTRTARAPR